MGQYNTTIITNAGQSMIAQAIAEGQTITITHAKTSSYQYPGGTNFQELTDLQEIQQTVVPSSAGVFNDTLIQVLVSFSNESITEAYLIHAVGLYAQLGSGSETLIAICTAITPDQMPAYDNVAPSAYIYNIQITVSQVSSLTVQVNPAGTVTAQQFLELQGKVNAIQQEIGTLSELDTTEKDSLVGASNELFNRIPPKDNLLCNADFASGIINTQGQSSYTSPPDGTIQTINGWQMTGEGKVTVRNDSVLFACDTSAGVVTSFPVLSTVQSIRLKQGQSYTLTAIASGVVGTVQIKIDGQTLTVSDGTHSLTWEQGEDTEAIIQITLATQSSTAVISGLKLEESAIYTGMPPWDVEVERLRVGALQETIPPKENILANANFAAGIINTPGKSSYAVGAGAEDGTYIIDGWKIVKHSTGITTLTVGSGKISLSGNGYGLSQIFKGTILTYGKPYILTAYINGEVKTFRFLGGISANNDWAAYFAYWPSTQNTSQHRIEIKAENFPCDINWVKLEEGTEYTGFQPWNAETERLKAGTYVPVNNLDTTEPGHPLDAAQGPRLSAWLRRMMIIYVGSANTFKFRSRYSSTDSVGSRQTIFIFGRANAVTVAGILIINSGSTTCGYTSFVGASGNLTATLSGNVVTVTLPAIAFDLFTLISGDIIAEA